MPDDVDVGEMRISRTSRERGAVGLPLKTAAAIEGSRFIVEDHQQLAICFHVPLMTARRHCETLYDRRGFDRDISAHRILRYLQIVVP
jgi:hypothetical protein